MVQFQFEVNAGGLQNLDPVESSNTHGDFYDIEKYRANHGYYEADVCTVFLHRSTLNDTYGLVITHHDASTAVSDKYGVETTFSQLLNSTDAYIVKDDNNDGYSSSSMRHQFNGNKTDGAVIDVAQFSDVTISLNHTFEGDTTDQDLDDFRVIYQDGSAPDGGAVEYAGKYGTIRITVPDALNPIVRSKEFPTEGDTVVLLREDLAHL